MKEPVVATTAGWRELLAAARAGSMDACGKLLESHRTYLLAVATSELDAEIRSKVDVADIVQECLFHALVAFTTFCGNEPSQLRAWIRAILVHRILNQCRRFKGTAMRNIAHELPLPIPQHGGLPGEGIASDDDTPSSEALLLEERERLQQILTQIPVHYRDVVDWRIQDGLKFAEIGQRLGCSEDAAKQLWHRAIHCLKSKFGLRE